MRLARLSAALVVLGGGTALADTPLLDLTPAQRSAFGAEVRALLLDEPEIVDRALNPPGPAAQEMAQKIADDQALLAVLEPEILKGARIALFVGPECPTCTRASEELAALSAEYGVEFILHDTTNPATARLADQLGMTELPFYVLPGMILRGHMPPIVLPRYLD